MDVSPTALVSAFVENRQAQLQQDVQLRVLKTAMDVQAAGALALLQAVPGAMPLASSGSVGTQVNVYA